MKTLKAFIPIMFLTLLITGYIHADAAQLSGSASIDVMSNYVWRGQKLSNSWVVQPSVGITYGVFGANIWANYDSDSKINEGDGHGELSETDITLNYTRSIDRLTLSAGYIYYALNGVNDTQELYISAAYDTLLEPALTVYYDFDEGQGAFITASLGHSFEVANGTTLNLGAAASYNIKNKIMGYNGDGDDFCNFYNVEFSSSLTMPMWKALTVAPKIAYSFPLSNDAEEAISSLSDDGDRDIFYGGINLTLSF